MTQTASKQMIERIASMYTAQQRQAGSNALPSFIMALRQLSQQWDRVTQLWEAVEDAGVEVSKDYPFQGSWPEVGADLDKWIESLEEIPDISASGLVSQFRGNRGAPYSDYLDDFVKKIAQSWDSQGGNPKEMFDELTPVISDLRSWKKSLDSKVSDSKYPSSFRMTPQILLGAANWKRSPLTPVVVSFAKDLAQSWAEVWAEADGTASAFYAELEQIAKELEGWKKALEAKYK